MAGNVEVAFTTTIMRTFGSVIPPQKRRRPGRGLIVDAQTKAELRVATDAIHATGLRLNKIDPRDAQLRRVVRHTCNSLKTVRSAAVVRFSERHDVELKKHLRMRETAWILPKHQISAAGGDEEGRITVRP